MDEWIQLRRNNAQMYVDILQKMDVIVPVNPAGCKHAFHIFSIQLNERERIVNALRSKKIGVALQYPLPLPFLKPYAHFGFIEEDFPVASNFTEKQISLPMYPKLSSRQIQEICSTLKETIKQLYFY